MFNGVGLTTPRGSGTNGYVQRSLASLPPIRIAKHHDQHGHITRPKSRVNPEIAMHEKLRSLEVRLLEIRVKNEGKIPPGELDEMLTGERERLTKLLQQDVIALKLRENDSNRLAEQKLHQNENMERALKLGARKLHIPHVERMDTVNTSLTGTPGNAKIDRPERWRERSHLRSRSASRQKRYKISLRSYSNSRGRRKRCGRSHSYDSSDTLSYSSRGSSRSYSRDRSQSYSSGDSPRSNYSGEESYSSEGRSQTKERHSERSRSVEDKRVYGTSENLNKRDRKDHGKHRRYHRGKLRSRSFSSRSSSRSSSRNRSYLHRRRRRDVSSRRYDKRRVHNRNRSSSIDESRRGSDSKKPIVTKEDKRISVSPEGGVERYEETPVVLSSHIDTGVIHDDGELSDSSMEHSDN